MLPLSPRSRSVSSLVQFLVSSLRIAYTLSVASNGQFPLVRILTVRSCRVISTGRLSREYGTSGTDSSTTMNGHVSGNMPVVNLIIPAAETVCTCGTNPIMES